MRTLLGTFTTSLILLACACESGSGSSTESDAASEATTGAPGSDDTTTRGDSDTITHGDVPTTDASAGDDGDAPTTSTDPTTGDDTTTPDDTTGDVPPDPAIVEACTTYCQRWTDCNLQPDEAACIAGCADMGPIDATCAAAQTDALACVSALSCVDLIASLDEGGPCADAKTTASEVCDGGEDNCVVGGGESSEGCDFSRLCDGLPERTIACDDETCTCLSDQVKVGECAADGVCADPDALAAKAAACCGF